MLWFLLLALATTPPPPVPLPVETVKIASFNIRILSNNSRDEEELQLIAEVIQRYDLVAIQEIRDMAVMTRLIGLLPEYIGHMSPPVGRGVKERYAFMWRSDKVGLVTDGQFYPERHDEFIREPWYATFRAGQFDFTLVTVHILFGKSRKDRRPELRALSHVMEWVQIRDPLEQDIILLGDFNAPPTDAGWDILKQSFPQIQHILDPPIKTTITDTSLYDNIWFDSRFTTEYTGDHGMYRFDEDMFDNDDKRASKMVSDHRPIWATFTTDTDDD